MKVATQGERKVLLVFQKITKTKKFFDEIAKVRNKLSIPENGYVFKRLKLDDRKYRKFSVKNKYEKAVEELILMFPVMNRYFSLLLRNYIYYNRFLYVELEKYSDSTFNVCRLMSAEEESEYFLLPEEEYALFSIRSHNTKAGGVLYSYPVSIRIRQDTSQNTLIDFIKKNWSEIVALQKEYARYSKNIFKYSKNKLDASKSERNEFIYKHKDLPRKQIMALLTDKFGATNTLDVASIGKIITLEAKKREDFDVK